MPGKSKNKELKFPTLIDKRQKSKTPLPKHKKKWSNLWKPHLLVAHNRGHSFHDVFSQRPQNAYPSPEQGYLSSTYKVFSQKSRNTVQINYDIRKQEKNVNLSRNFPFHVGESLRKSLLSLWVSVCEMPKISLLVSIKCQKRAVITLSFGISLQVFIWRNAR